MTREFAEEVLKETTRLFNESCELIHSLWSRWGLIDAPLVHDKNAVYAKFHSSIAFGDGAGAEVALERLGFLLDSSIAAARYNRGRLKGWEREEFDATFLPWAERLESSWQELGKEMV